MECDPHRLTPSRRCDQPPAVRAAPCIYRTTVFNKLQHLFHLAAASAAMPRPHAVRRRAPVARASRSKARLQDVTTRRRFMAKPCTPHLIPQAEQFFKIETTNVRRRGGRPLVLSLGGCKGGYSLSRKRVSPFYALLRGAGNSSPLCERHYSLFGSGSPASESRYRYSGISSRKPARTSSLSSGVNSTPSGLSS